MLEQNLNVPIKSDWRVVVLCVFLCDLELSLNESKVLVKNITCPEAALVDLLPPLWSCVRKWPLLFRQQVGGRTSAPRTSWAGSRPAKAESKFYCLFTFDLIRFGYQGHSFLSLISHYRSVFFWNTERTLPSVSMDTWFPPCHWWPPVGRRCRACPGWQIVGGWWWVCRTWSQKRRRYWWWRCLHPYLQQQAHCYEPEAHDTKNCFSNI